MPEHFTRSTVFATFYCRKCGKFTPHRIDDARKGPCLDCIQKLEALHAAPKVAPPAQQTDLFPGIL